MAKPDHIPNLDGLRGIAALLVLWAHFPIVTNTLFKKLLLLEYKEILSAGYIGVDIFFVLSGFLITRILIHYRQDSVPYGYFFIRRSLRIFPVYYLVIGLLAVLAPSTQLKWCAAYLSNFYFAIDLTPHYLRHTWSLAVEEHFYLIWPLLVYWKPLSVTQKWISWYAPIIALTSTIITLVLFEPELAERLIYRCTMYRMLSLSVGCSIAFHEAEVRDTLQKRAILLWITCICTGICIMLARYITPFGGALFIEVGGTLLSAGIVIFCIRSDEKITKPLRSKPFRYLGSISYGLYLYHYIIYVYFGMTAIASHSLHTAALAVSLTFAIAAISYEFFEKPLLRLSLLTYKAMPRRA